MARKLFATYSCDERSSSTYYRNAGSSMGCRSYKKKFSQILDQCLEVNAQRSISLWIEDKTWSWSISTWKVRNLILLDLFEEMANIKHQIDLFIFILSDNLVYHNAINNFQICLEKVRKKVITATWCLFVPIIWLPNDWLANTKSDRTKQFRSSSCVIKCHIGKEMSFILQTSSLMGILLIFLINHLFACCLISTFWFD